MILDNNFIAGKVSEKICRGKSRKSLSNWLKLQTAKSCSSEVKKTVNSDQPPVEDRTARSNTLKCVQRKKSN